MARADGTSEQLAGEERAKSELDAGERSKPADRETPARAGEDRQRVLLLAGQLATH